MAEQQQSGGEWALVKPTLNADQYIPVEVVRRGKRFTFVRTLGGAEWRYTTRGLWDGFGSYGAAHAEIEKMRAYRTQRAALASTDRELEA